MTSSVTTKDFKQEVLEKSKEIPVLVDFWAPWCGPCRQVSPIVDLLGEDNVDRLKVVKVNIDEEPELASFYGVMSIPFLQLFSQGEPVADHLGAAPKEVILRSFSEYLPARTSNVTYQF